MIIILCCVCYYLMCTLSFGAYASGFVPDTPQYYRRNIDFKKLKELSEKIDQYVPYDKRKIIQERPIEERLPIWEKLCSSKTDKKAHPFIVSLTNELIKSNDEKIIKKKLQFVFNEIGGSFSFHAIEPCIEWYLEKGADPEIKKKYEPVKKVFKTMI